MSSAPEAGAGITAVVANTSSAEGTTTLANLAGLLAGAGRRVLVLDWAAEFELMTEYLRPFRVGSDTPPEAEGVIQATADLSPGAPPSAQRFVLTGTPGHIDVVSWPEAPDLTTAQRDAADGLRFALAYYSGYDDVLIDVRTTTADESLDFVARLCDTAVVCFRPVRTAIEASARLAARVAQQATRNVTIVPVATMFDASYPARAARVRAEMRSVFAAKVHDDLVAPVEIPYLPSDSYYSLLAVLVEEQSPDSALHAGYERLATIITRGAVTGPVPIPATLRARYRRTFGLDPAAVPEEVLVVYAPPDRPWADWISGVLARGGVQAKRFAVDAPAPDTAGLIGMVVVDSAHLAESTAVVDETHAGSDSVSLRVLVDEAGSLRDWPGKSITVASATAQELRGRLLAHFGLFDQPGHLEERERLPGDRPAVFEVPARNPHFVGQDRSMERLRDQLTESDGTTSVTLSGPPGVGKSSLALEYAHRFRGDYDLVWWLPATDTTTLLTGLTELAARLEVRRAGGTALERLQAIPYYQRFLLVFDNVDDPAELDALLPAMARGHVIVTTGVAPDPDIALGAMRTRDSVRLLTDRVRGLSKEDAEVLATDVGNVPVALEITAAWLTQTVAAERRGGYTVADAAAWASATFLDRRREAAGEDTEATSWSTVSQVVGVVTASLRSESPLGRIAVLLAKLCAFLSPDGIGLDLVRSAGMRRALMAESGADAAALAQDAGEIDRVLWLGTRYGLFQVFWGTEHAVRQHRVVQAALREVMPVAEHSARLTTVHQVLADFAPSEVDDAAPDYAARFTELQRHMLSSGAMASTADAVRRWLVNQVRHQYVHGGPAAHRAALGPTQKLLEDWTSRHGAADPLRLRLAGQLANLHRALGDPAQALRLDEEVLAEQRRSSELLHPRTLTSARGRGGDLRGLGLFDDALLEDRSTWEGFSEELGTDHPQTQMAANNLAVSLFLAGDTAGACAMAEANYERRRRLLGEDNPRTWSSLAKVGVYRRELGEFDTAMRMLSEAGQRLRTLLPEPHPTELAVRYQWAVTRRHTGASIVAREMIGTTTRDHREFFGPDHPATLACVLSLAAAERGTGRPEVAVELAEEALRGFLQLVGDRHPFVALCRLGFGLAMTRTGRTGLSHIAAAAESLNAGLGDVHPWTLAAAVDHAVAIAVDGDRDRAGELLRTTHEDCAEYLGPWHPYTKTAAHNLSMTHADPSGVPGPGWKDIDVDIPDT